MVVCYCLTTLFGAGHLIASRPAQKDHWALGTSRHRANQRKGCHRLGYWNLYHISYILNNRWTWDRHLFWTLTIQAASNITLEFSSRHTQQHLRSRTQSYPQTSFGQVGCHLPPDSPLQSCLWRKEHLYVMADWFDNSRPVRLIHSSCQAHELFSLILANQTPHYLPSFTYMYTTLWHTITIH